MAIHDFSILDYLIDEKPISVMANGVAHYQGQKENIAYITLVYNNNFIANIHVNWISPLKIRKILIGCDQKMLVYDDLEPTEKIKIFDKGILSTKDNYNSYQIRVGYRMGDVYSPHLENTEALNAVIKHFRNCIINKSKPLTDGLSGLRVVKIIEAATSSMENSGEPVKI